MGSLHDIAPRLARARDQWIAHRAEQARLDIVFADWRLSLERLIAHRELQLVRAQARGNGRYIRERTIKLADARRRLHAMGRLDRNRKAAA